MFGRLLTKEAEGSWLPTKLVHWAMLALQRFGVHVGFPGKAIYWGIREIIEGSSSPGRIQRLGAGRNRITTSGPRILAALEYLIEPDTRVDPESPLR
jgi:hypothetical protein